MKKIGRAFLFFLLHFGLVFLLFSVLRLLFFAFNHSYFPDTQLINFIGGIRFDWLTITLLYAPFLLLFPFLFHRQSAILKVFFLLSSGLAIALNAIDFEYYKFTLKRTTADLFTTKGIAQDIGNLFVAFFVDYWYIIAVAVILFWLIAKGYEKLRRFKTSALSVGQSLLFFLILLLIYAPGVRGGLQYRPLNVVNASAYAKAKNVSIVLNTPFTIIKSAYKEDIERVDYFPADELKSIYSPVHHFAEDSAIKRLNVVVIIAESFSKEYVGALNDYAGYTPFLDSLINNGLVFTNAFANGKKSIESLPAILSGIPTLMNSSYITGRFATNQIEGLPAFLERQGYATTFYHGGENGTMGFQAFSQMAGAERYVGRNEYPNQDDYDGHWGIFDKPFLQFCAADMNATPQPFFASIFTLSSHHPYTVPEPYKGRFEGGPLPILKSVEYADYSLQQFFETAATMPWFDETLFVITADHTSQSYTTDYSSSMGIYRIPILFYCPKYIDPQRDDRIMQQNDIFPSVVDFLGHDAAVLAFGNSVFSNSVDPFSISYLNNIYQLVQGDYCLQYDGSEVIAFYNWKADPELQKNLIASADFKPYERKIKAIIQQYNNRLIENKLMP
ncbi:LTA synthase family protein [Cryomorpha ignava]|uniref:LTA synthase family protein n=1 Tax=Cryomorpha ignava TaxID=101383 RepID=A0A7K3WXM4_9FLAO|nr:LTA synthase family protein [Cryomorpha ignava]NEN25385.1 LTA synthase family protein [Cryomorpha ignava]